MRIAVDPRLHLALLAVAAAPAVELPMRGRILARRARHYSDEAIARMLETVAAEDMMLFVERAGEDRILCWGAPTFRRRCWSGRWRM